jgi:hypothetical protein
VRKATRHVAAPGFNSNTSSNASVVLVSQFEPRVTRLSQQSGGTDGRVRPRKIATSKQPFKKPVTEKKLHFCQNPQEGPTRGWKSFEFSLQCLGFEDLKTRSLCLRAIWIYKFSHIC